MPHIYSNEERSRLIGEVDFVSASATELTEEMLKLTKGPPLPRPDTRVYRKSGRHFHMASPACREEDGDSELEKCHLAVNVNKWLAGEDMIAYCMKTSTPYNIMDLLSMPPLSQRGYEDKPEVIRVSAMLRQSVAHPLMANF